ncbi:MAG: serine hydrolase domain-containing protein, partial [Planctomycetaceae bacterium]
MPRFAISRRPLAATCIRRWRSRLTASLAAACLALAPLGPLVAADTPAATQSPAHVTAPAPTREQCLAAAKYSAQHAGRAVLVRHAGQVVFEQYDRGWSAPQAHPLASGTKSFTGVLALLAVQDGLLTLDERACDTLTEWRDDPRKSQITVRHLLTLSSGLEPGDRELGGRAGAGGVLGEGAARRAKRLGLSSTGPRPENLNAVALELPTRHDPGTRFDYGPSHFYAFSELLERKLAQSNGLDKTTLAFLQNRLLKPLEITPFRIGRDRQGHPNLPGGMVLTALEWSHFGQFVLDRGSVVKPGAEPRELLRPELLAQCFEPSPANPRYGLTWWLKSSDGVADGEPADDSRRAVPLARLRRRAPQPIAFRDEHGQPLDVWMAAGLGKQRL